MQHSFSCSVTILLTLWDGKTPAENLWNLSEDNEGWNFKKTYETHEKKPYSIDAVKVNIDYHSTVDDVALENEIVWSYNEYRRKLELGSKIKEIVLKNKIPTVSLYKDKTEALELFEKQGQVKKI